MTVKDKTGRGVAYFTLFGQYLAAVTDESGVISQGNKCEAEGVNTTPLDSWLLLASLTFVKCHKKCSSQALFTLCVNLLLCLYDYNMFS
jgi:hypothetical protein